MTNPPPRHRPRKRFGQNFLRDAAVIDRIADAVHARAAQHLVEIGPGQGALTGAFHSLNSSLSFLCYRFLQDSPFPHLSD